MRPLIIAVIVWLVLIAAASILGGYSSLYTGIASELPKWNGWSYLLFCAREFAILGAVLTLPVAVLVFIGAWMASRRQDAA